MKWRAKFLVALVTTTFWVSGHAELNIKSGNPRVASQIADPLQVKSLKEKLDQAIKNTPSVMGYPTGRKPQPLKLIGPKAYGPFSQKGNQIPKDHVSKKSTSTSKVAATAAVTASSFYVSDPLYFDSSDYVDNMNYVYWGTFTSIDSSTTTMYVEFDSIDMESGYDYIHLYDGNGNLCESITGLYSSGRTSAPCSGNYVDVYISTDSSVNGATHSGFVASGYTYEVGGNTAPVAVGYANTYSAPLGYQFLFTGSSSYDPDTGDSLSFYEWDFGDGTTWTSSLDVYHTYAAPGIYDVTLTVWDQEEWTSYDTFQVEVRPAPTPTNLIISQALARSINLSWQSGGSDSSGFIVRWVSGYAPSLTCDSGTDLGFTTGATVSGLTPSTNYTFSVCSYNSYGYKSNSVITYGPTTAIQYPPTPTGLNANPLFSNRATLNWNSGGGNTASFIYKYASGSSYPGCSGGTVLSSSTRSLNLTNLSATTTYSVSLCARNSDGDIGSPAQLQFTTPATPPAPPAVTSLNLGAATSSSIPLSWVNGGGSTYSIKALIVAGTNPGSCASLGTDIGLVQSTTFTGLQKLTTYSISICAVNNVGVAGPQINIQATTLDAPPPAPTSFRVTATTQTSIALAWNSGGQNTASFLVNMAQGNVSTLQCTGGTDVGLATSFTFSSLSANTQYTFVVCARNSQNMLSSKVSLTQTTPSSTATPPTPTNLTLSSSSSTTLTANWASTGGSTTGFIVNKATGNNLFLSCNGGVTIGNVRTYTLTGLTANTQYTVAICAINSNGTKSGTVRTTGTTQTAPPPAPTNLNLVSITSTGMTALWTSGGGSTAGFVINKALGNVPSLTCSGGTILGNVTSSAITGLTASTLYTFAVCSRNSSGALSTSIVKTATTLAPSTIPPVPTGLQVTGKTTSSIAIKWVSGGGNTVGFKVAKATGSGATINCATGIDVGTSLTYNFTGLARWTSYTLGVCAKNASGELSAPVKINAQTNLF